MRIAVGICERYPQLYSKMRFGHPVTNSKEEELSGQILAKLLELEPCLKIVLDFINLKK